MKEFQVGDVEKEEGGGMEVKVVLVAVKASSKEIRRDALVWALSHIVQPKDLILLLVSHTHGRDKNEQGWMSSIGFCFGLEEEEVNTVSYSQVFHQLQDIYDPNKVNLKVKIVTGSSYGMIASEAKQVNAYWVILDRQLKLEKKVCMEELQCNIVFLRRSQAMVLRINLAHRNPGLAVTPASSPDHGAAPFAPQSVWSSDTGASPFLINCVESNKRDPVIPRENRDPGSMFALSSSPVKYCTTLFSSMVNFFKNLEENSATRIASFGGRVEAPVVETHHDPGKDVREVISLSGNAPLGPPPLCSICRHKAPEFGKPPKWFSFIELSLATGGFSQANFLAEGAFGSVHRGVLPDGQAVAVKQHKFASTQGDREFCSEVEVLSRAQHRNVVMLIGFCVEKGKRLLVYEYICNSSLNSHLYGFNDRHLEWSARQRVAVGAARGLRYLHEECRVGCIVHRDLRPNNILVTHDFEPLVGDFGLARWQPDGEAGVETRIVGRFGYLAPEYAESGQITEKADIYAFGVVLMELVTGRKAMDICRPKGQKCLTEWVRPLVKRSTLPKLVDPNLMNCYDDNQVFNMLLCASMCVQKDPFSRPRMSQVLKILEGEAEITLKLSRILPQRKLENRRGTYIHTQ